MKHIGVWIISAVCIFAMNTARAEEGETIFKSQGCTHCHKKESHSKVNPSLTEIAAAYQGMQEQLVKFLNGEAEAIVKPQKAGMMKRYVKRTKALSDADRKALADYILRQQ
jgi:cytochrome c551/c552